MSQFRASDQRRRQIGQLNYKALFEILRGARKEGKLRVSFKRSSRRPTTKSSDVTGDMIHTTYGVYTFIEHLRSYKQVSIIFSSTLLLKISLRTGTYLRPLSFKNKY